MVELRARRAPVSSEDPELLSAGGQTNWVGNKCFRESKTIRTGKRLAEPVTPRRPRNCSTAVGCAVTVLSDMPQLGQARGNAESFAAIPPAFAPLAHGTP